MSPYTVGNEVWVPIRGGWDLQVYKAQASLELAGQPKSQGTSDRQLHMVTTVFIHDDDGRKCSKDLGSVLPGFDAQPLRRKPSDCSSLAGIPEGPSAHFSPPTNKAANLFGFCSCEFSTTIPSFWCLGPWKPPIPEMDEEHIRISDGNSVSMLQPSSSPSPSPSPSPFGRVVNALLSSHSRQLEAAVSRFGSTSQRNPGVLLDDSLCFLKNYVSDAVEKGEPLDQILVPMLEHTLKRKGLKNCKQVLILLNWLFEDDLLFEAVSINLAEIVSRKEDHYISFGWCTLVRALLDTEINPLKVSDIGKQEKRNTLLKTLCCSISDLLSIICKGRTGEKFILQDGFELPTRLSVAAADCILLLTEALTNKAPHYDVSRSRTKSSNTCITNRPVSFVQPDSSKKERSLTSKLTQDLEDLKMELLLWHHIEELVTLVRKLQAPVDLVDEFSWQLGEFLSILYCKVPEMGRIWDAGVQVQTNPTSCAGPRLIFACYPHFRPDIKPSAAGVGKDIAEHLLDCLSDKEVLVHVQASNLITQIDPALVLPALLQLVYSKDERVCSSASDAVIAILKCHNKNFDVISMLLDSLRMDESLKLGSRSFNVQDSVELKDALFDHLCSLLIIRVLPLKIFNDLNSSVMYGQLLKQGVLQGHFFCLNLKKFINLQLSFVAVFTLKCSWIPVSWEVVPSTCLCLVEADKEGDRKELKVLLPIVRSIMGNAAHNQDSPKLKACLFAVCTSLVVRGQESASHPDMVNIRKILETVLLWPSADTDEGPGTVSSSVLSYVMQRLICQDSVTSTESGANACFMESSTGYQSSNTVLMTNEGLVEHSIPIPFRVCMANVLISACQKISSPGKHSFAKRILPTLILSIEVDAGNHGLFLVICHFNDSTQIPDLYTLCVFLMVSGIQVVTESLVRAACLQVLFSAVYHLKSAVLPHSSALLKISIKVLRKGSEKERIASAKLMASLMASDDAIVESISSGLLEAKSVLESISSKNSSPELRQLCEKLLMCKQVYGCHSFPVYSVEKWSPQGCYSYRRLLRYLRTHEMVEFLNCLDNGGIFVGNHHPASLESRHACIRTRMSLSLKVPAVVIAS
ncbi:hypothetical protein ACLOJK_016054 [Asimina triloba]